jgi:hypothetical protein
MKKNFTANGVENGNIVEEILYRIYGRNEAFSLSQLVFAPHWGAPFSECHSICRGQYEDVLVDNGFDTLDFLSTITEDDLKLLGFKLGHKRQVYQLVSFLLFSNFTTLPRKRHNLEKRRKSRLAFCDQA